MVASGGAELRTSEGKLLFIDEDVIDHDHLGAMLRDEGFVVERAESVPLALDRMSHVRFDAVVIGDPAGGLDSFRMLGQLRNAYPRGTMPVLLVQSGAENGAIERGLNGGASDVISFSQGYPAARARIQKAVDRHRVAAFRDPQSGLATPGLLRDHINRALAGARREDYLSAVLLVSIDRLRPLMDGLQPSEADALMRSLSDSIRDCVRERDTVARIAANSFAILAEDVRLPKNALRVARRIEERVRAAHPALSTRTGIATGNADHTESDQIMSHAQDALSRAGSDSPAVLFDAHNHETAVESLDFEVHLEAAAAAGDFTVFYQPIVRVGDGSAAGCEALVRWRHPTRGLIAPGEFIPVGEDTGLIVEIGRQVLLESCRQAVEWQTFFPGLRIAVNVSGQQLEHPDIVDHFVEAITTTGIDPNTLRIELTESVIMGDFEAAGEVLDHLVGLGVRLAIDDFGTGYSALSYLHRLPASTIKIDRRFVQDLTTPHAPSMARTIILLAHSLEMDVVAEGVETAEDLETLQVLGCDFVQGFHVARPMPADQAEAWLRERTQSK